MAETNRQQVSVHNRAMVMPAQPTHAHNFFLSCLDLYWQGLHYNQRLIFYQSTITDDGRQGVSGQEGREAAVMEKLKSSLALCLVHYYPWCGRIAKGAEPPHRLFIDCSDAGVEFVEASSHLPLSLLARDGFQMKPLFQELCQHPDHKGDSFFSSPLLSIQATLFSDGGLVLGIAHSHVVADGQSLWNFMVSWGECSRGVPLSLPPLHNREMLAVLHPSPDKATWSLNPQIKEEDKEEEEMYSDKGDSLIQKDEELKISSAGAECTMNKDKDSSVGVYLKTYEDKDRIVGNKYSTGDEDSSAGVIKDNSSNVRTHASANEDNARSLETDRHKHSSAGTNASSGGYKTDPLVQCMFELPASAIQKLKCEAGKGHTSFEIICSHFWKHITAARENATIEPTYFYAPVNCRTRMTPPVPSSYFGNVVAFDVILSTVGAIRRETLCATACRVHDMVARIKEDFLLGFMHWLETHNNNIDDLFVSTLRGKGLGMSSSPWFPAYQVDYGWGKPVAVRSANVHGDGELVLFGGHPGSMQGDVEICTALRESVLRRLLSDPTFLAKPPSSPLANDL